MHFLFGTSLLFFAIAFVVFGAKQAKNSGKLQLTVYEIATVYNMTDLTQKPNCPNLKQQLWSWSLIVSYVEEKNYKKPWILSVEAPYYIGAVDATQQVVDNSVDPIVHFTLFFGRSCAANETDVDFVLPCDSNANVTISTSVVKSPPILQAFCDDKVWIVYGYKWIK